MSEKFNISFNNEDAGQLVVYVKGEIDIYTSEEFKLKLNEAAELGNGPIIVDCTHLEYIDSTGLGIFVGVFKKLKQKNRNIKIINLKDSIKKLFSITSLDKLFEIK